MSYRSNIVVLILCGLTLVSATEVRSQSTNPTTDRNPFRSEAETRFGRVKIGEMPEQLDYSNSRISTDGFKMGRLNTFLGVDLDAPSSRLGRYKLPPPLKPTDFLSEKPAKPKEPHPSANIPVEAVTAESQAVPLRRPTGFFERPDVMAPPEIPGESTIRTPTEQRWFRDIGRRPGLADRPGLGGQGEAIVVGSEMAAPETSGTGEAADPRQQQWQNRQAAMAAQAAAIRRFEQKLESMLLGTAKVQFLSPVQVSFQNGVVTVRGVVPDQQNKVAAGNILLTDPAVKQVNNLISVVPADRSNLPKPIEPK